VMSTATAARPLCGRYSRVTTMVLTVFVAEWMPFIRRR